MCLLFNKINNHIKILVTSSWMSGKDSVEENSDRKVLASSITEITHKYARILDHAKWWHQDVKVPKQVGTDFSTIHIGSRGKRSYS